MSGVHVHYPPSLVLLDVPSLVFLFGGVTLMTRALFKRFSWHSRAYARLSLVGATLLVLAASLFALNKVISATTRLNIKFLYDQRPVGYGLAFCTFLWAAVLFFADLRVYTHKQVVLDAAGNVPDLQTHRARRRRRDATDVEQQPLFVSDDEDDDEEEEEEHGGGGGGGGGGVLNEEAKQAVSMSGVNVAVGLSDAEDEEREQRRARKRLSKLKKRMERRRRRHRPRSGMMVFGVPALVALCLGLVTFTMWYDARTWGRGPAVAWQIITVTTGLGFLSLMAFASHTLGWKEATLSFGVTAFFAVLVFVVFASTTGVWAREVVEILFRVALGVTGWVFWMRCSGRNTVAVCVGRLLPW